MFSDSHCHLRGAAGDAIRRAEEAGVELVVVAGIDVASSEEAVRTAADFSMVKACVGIHPWYADAYSPESLERLKELAGKPEVVAVSEIGLDYVGRMTPEWVRTDEIIDPEVQRTALRGQLRLARELGLPVLVHDRTPGLELLEILEEEAIAQVGAAIHGFAKDAEYAARAVEMGVYLSIGRSVVREKNEVLMEAIRQVPLDWILTETDSSDPTGVLEVAEKVAEVKGLTREDVGRAATRNLKKLLKL